MFMGRVVVDGVVTEHALLVILECRVLGFGPYESRVYNRDGVAVDHGLSVEVKY